MAKGQNFTIIKESGRTEYFADADYYSVLSGIAHEYGSAGGNWDRPNMLLLNGKVVVHEGIAEIAWKFGQRNRELHDKLHEQIRAEFKPDWLSEAK